MSTSREQSTRSSAMAALQCYVFSWSHEGRREGLFLEATAMQGIHLIRRTRRGNIRWGFHGTWRLFMIRGQPVPQLDNFQCCPQAHVRHLTFAVDPRNRGFMVDQRGRVIRFLGRLSMVIFAGPSALCPYLTQMTGSPSEPFLRQRGTRNWSRRLCPA